MSNSSATTPAPAPDREAAVIANSHPEPALAPAFVNLSTTGFLATLRQAAVDASSVFSEFTSARLLSFSRAFARGWGPSGSGRYERRSIDDKIFPDLKLPAEDDPEERGHGGGAGELARASLRPGSR